MAGSNPIEAGCVDRLNIAGFLESGRQPQQHPPDPHFEVLFARTDRREIRQVSHCQVEFGDYFGHFVQDIHQPSVGMSEILSKAMQSHD
jgi:hypothetical protein